MICKRKSIFVFLLIAFNIYVGALAFTQIVEATGGAFPNTKMGGNDLDNEAGAYGSWVGGVNRSINDSTPWSLGATNAAPEYSVYSSGECPQCHELHASFGGKEPIPADGGPHQLLTFKDSQTNQTGVDFCLYCHDQFDFPSINSTDSGSLGDPPKGFGSLGVFQNNSTSNVFKESSHYTQTGFLWPKPNNGLSEANTIHPRRTRTTAQGTCLNCHTPHGIMGKAGAAYDTAAVPETVQAKPANHPITGRTLVGDIDTAYLIPRHKIAFEEALCENCHDDSGSANTPAPPSIQPEIDKRNPGGSPGGASSGCGSGHPVDVTAFSGQHSTKEPVENRERHVECYDCHNPHAVRNPGRFPSGDSGRIMGTKYVEIDGTIKIAGVGGAGQPEIMELCFRCHGDTFAFVTRKGTADSANGNPFVALGASKSDYTGTVNSRNRGNYDGTGFNQQLGWSNKRIEFNPNTAHTAAGQSTNTAYHPVAVPGRNLSLQLCNQLKSAFGFTCANAAGAAVELANHTINCTDCHNNDMTGANASGGLVGVRGPVTESSLRAMDTASSFPNPLVTTQAPVGPHGSIHPRILRGYYNTSINPSTVDGTDDGFEDDTANAAMDSNFALCFLCHNSQPFKTGENQEDWTNFQGGGGGRWGESLHYLHLNIQQSVNTSANFVKCHECHNNVHSNVESNNMQYKDGAGNGFTSDTFTHLLNFGPQAMPDSFVKPAWYFGDGRAPGGDVLGEGNLFRCNLICHGKTMSECGYLGRHDGGPDGTGSC